MRSIGPVVGTSELSVALAASLPKSTFTKNGLTSPRVSCSLCWRSRQNRAFTSPAAALSTKFVQQNVGIGSFSRGPTFTIATPFGVPPPGVVAVVCPGCGARYVPAAGSHRPTPIVVRTLEVPGFHAACGTRTWIWRRPMSTLTFGAGVSVFPDDASVRTAVPPCHVRNTCAGDETPAPSGHATEDDESPSAIVKAVLFGSSSVFSVTRKAVAEASGSTRSSTRSAALFAYTLSVGYV